MTTGWEVVLHALSWLMEVNPTKGSWGFRRFFFFFFRKKRLVLNSFFFFSWPFGNSKGL